MKTYMANSNTVERKWYVVDAKGKTLGRLSSEIAKILRGKHTHILPCGSGDLSSCQCRVGRGTGKKQPEAI